MKKYNATSPSQTLGPRCADKPFWDIKSLWDIQNGLKRVFKQKKNVHKKTGGSVWPIFNQSRCIYIYTELSVARYFSSGAPAPATFSRSGSGSALHFLVGSGSGAIFSLK